MRRFLSRRRSTAHRSSPARGSSPRTASGFGFEGCIFRFVSILGERYTHGHVFDFYKSLRMDPARLRVLGNGKQRKSYLYVGDCLDAMLLAMSKVRGASEVFNLGTDEYCEVNDSIGWICERLGVSPVREYTGGDRGWIGDNPFIFLDTAKIRVARTGSRSSRSATASSARSSTCRRIPRFSRRAHEGRRARTVAPGVGDGGLRRGSRPSGDRLGSRCHDD